MTLDKTWTLPSGQVLTLAPSKDGYGKPHETPKVLLGEEVQPNLRRALLAAQEQKAAEERKAARIEAQKALKGKRPTKPKRLEAFVTPEGITLFVRGKTSMSPVFSVSSVSDNGNNKQVYFVRPRSKASEQETMKSFFAFTAEQKVALDVSQEVLDEARKAVVDYQPGIGLNFWIDDDVSLKVQVSPQSGGGFIRTYEMGFMPSMDPSDPEVVVIVAGKMLPFDTGYGMYGQKDLKEAIMADLGLVESRLENLGWRMSYGYVKAEDFPEWDLLASAQIEARTVYLALLNEARERASEMLLAYEAAFVAWKVEVEEWEQEWKP